MGTACAGDRYPVEVGQEHGHSLCRRPLSCRGGPGTQESSCTDHVHAPGPLLQDKDPAHASANAGPTSKLLSTSFNRHFCQTFRHYYVYDVTDTNCWAQHPAPFRVTVFASTVRSSQFTSRGVLWWQKVYIHQAVHTYNETDG